MRISRPTLLSLLVATALAGATAVSLPALGKGGDGHGHALLRSALAPSVPGDPTLHGVAPGAAPWVIDRSSARLRSDGGLRVRIRGLVIPSPPGNGTPGPVQTVSVSLYCGDDTAPADTTPAVPISQDGDARLSDTFTLPGKCLAPVLLVHPNGNAGLYIAAGGFGG